MAQPPRRAPRAIPAGIVGCLAFVLIGWSGLLVPSLIRSVESTFGQTDAGIGGFYFVYAVLYASGSLAGGLLTERLGRRTVLSLAAAAHGAGFLFLGGAPSWLVFVAAAAPAGLGAGALDGGVNGLYLDLFPEERGRALNVLHLFFSLGALSAPLAIGRLVESGTDWHVILAATGVAAIVLAVLLAVVPMPTGRHERAERPTAASGGWIERTRGRLALPLILLGVAIGCYVASEIGVSSWLVRFLEPAPLSTATTGLALFWAGLTLGRLVSARIADRFDHVRYTAACALATALALGAAIVAPTAELQIALFALAGFVTGPVYPMIMAIGGDRYPDRAAAVSGFLSGAAVVGSIVYPPVMGFLSVTVGLQIAMSGTVLLSLCCAAALVLVGRTPRPASSRTVEAPGGLA